MEEERGYIAGFTVMKIAAYLSCSAGRTHLPRTKIIQNIVDASFRSNAQGQRTHSARTNILRPEYVDFYTNPVPVGSYGHRSRHFVIMGITGLDVAL